MRKAVLAILILLLISTPIADGVSGTNLTSIHDIIELSKSSIIQLTGKTKDGDSFTGTGVVIIATIDATVVLTARHVADEGDLLTNFRGELYVSEKTIFVERADAALVWFPRIIGVLPIKPNLDPFSGKVKSIAIGFWGWQSSATATVGVTDRTVVSEMYDSHTIEHGQITSTQIVYFGYSGGALLDENGELLGINVALSECYSIAVDIRFIWNYMFGSDVKYDINYTFNQRGNNKNGWKRIGIDDSDTLIDGLSICELREKLVEEIQNDNLLITNSLINILTPGNFIFINNKKYEIVYLSADLKNKIRYYIGSTFWGMEYVMIFDDGYCVNLGLKLASE